MNPISDLRYTITLKRFLVSREIDLCFLYTIKPVIFGSFAAHAAQVPAIFSLITGLGYTFISKTFTARCISSVTTRLYAAALHRNRAVFFQNPDDEALFVQRGLIKPVQSIVVNGSGVDLDCYSEAPLPVGPPVFLMIARLLRAKGVFEYVRAAERIMADHPHCEFRLVGPLETGPDGIRREELEPWLSRGTVKYLGEVQDVRPELQSATVYVLPSYREGTPRTVLEAMATGRPIITTSTPGCRQTVIEGQNGFLVPPADWQALSAAMARFVADSRLAPRMGAESRRLAVEKFEVKAVNRVLMERMGLLEGSCSN